VEDCGDLFVALSFSFQVWRYSLTVAMSLLSTPSTAWQSPSACMIAKWSAYPCFLEAVFRDVDVEEECQELTLWDAVLEASFVAYNYGKIDTCKF